MMKIVPPKPFTFEAGPRAVLLLHGFTGNSADVRMLGRFLQERGYTSHAPHLTGHGVPPEALLDADPEQWWADVQNAYQHLQDLGYKEIAVGGLSLGGVYSLKCGYNLPVKGIVTMCAPSSANTSENIYEGVLKYAREWKQREGKSKEQVEEEMEVFYNTSVDQLVKTKEVINEVRDNIDMIYAPAFIAQATHDDMIDPQSATFIYESLESEHKNLKWYDDSPHVITFGDEKEQLHQDIYEFLEELDWTVS
ncbi:alpha/beta hydrolase [Tuberibacillus sp. Marseille-P3662]|uniref:alpha/beta hydrolase n=1 Tax=Tuberibacillus sp. Marseille-P3662 TaxID=1965358 RepID=UPI0026E47A22|nr:carboxylesterase [Tuberibacillus sp. Marseille-P3662]